MCQAESTGIISKELSQRSPGALHHSRRATPANRIPVLRLHVSTSNPSEKVKIWSNCSLMLLYAPEWFYIKSPPSVSDGAYNFWEVL